MPEKTVYYIKRQHYGRYTYLSVRALVHFDGSGNEVLEVMWKEDITKATRYSNLEEAQRMAERMKAYVATA